MTKRFAFLVFILSLFTPKSAYEVNLNLLLESLATHGDSSYGSFRTSGGKPSNADAVDSSFLCCGEVPEDVCAKFVKNASGTIKEKCPLPKASILWYDQCMLGYSDSKFFSDTDKAPLLYAYNQQNVEEPHEFMKLLNKTMDQMITSAAKGPSKSVLP